jgi:RNA polymerase subunit RPABC4/transcription elongation factor Spt4
MARCGKVLVVPCVVVPGSMRVSKVFHNASPVETTRLSVDWQPYAEVPPPGAPLCARCGRLLREPAPTCAACDEKATYDWDGDVLCLVNADGKRLQLAPTCQTCAPSWSKETNV